MVISKTSKTVNVLMFLVKPVKHQWFKINSQRITHGFKNIQNMVKQWFILVLDPAIGTLLS